MFFLKRNMSLTISQTLETLFIWVTLPSNVSRWLAYAFIWISYWLLTQSKLSHWLNKSYLFHVASFYLTLPNICICLALLLVNWLGSIPTIGWSSSTLGHVANWCLTLTHICARIQPRLIKRNKKYSLHSLKCINCCQESTQLLHTHIENNDAAFSATLTLSPSCLGRAGPHSCPPCLHTLENCVTMTSGVRLWYRYMYTIHPLHDQSRRRGSIIKFTLRRPHIASTRLSL